jgi:hypothetical protein
VYRHVPAEWPPALHNSLWRACVDLCVEGKHERLQLVPFPDRLPLQACTVVLLPCFLFDECAIVPSRLAPPDPAELIRIRELLHADEEDATSSSSLAALNERDRAIGRETGSLANHPLTQVMTWYRTRDPNPVQRNSAGRGLVMGCVLLGAAAGAVTAFGSFFYDGGQRVNVLLILALFCVLPLLSVAGFVLATFSRDGFATISGGQFGAIIARVLPGENLASFGRLAGGDAGSGMSKWLLLGWSQWLGLGYGLGALCVAMALVLFTDLAFGWSSTIELSTQTLLRIVHTFALPWHSALPQAVPDETLIGISRYFRLSSGTAMNADPVALARWWPFLMMAMLFYGVLTRVMTLATVRWRLRVACSEALLADASVMRLRQRMNTPLVRTQSLQQERRSNAEEAIPVFADLPAASDWQVVNWAEVPMPPDALDELVNIAVNHTAGQAGGARSSAQDRELIVRLVDCAAPAVLIIAKSWEPPTLDLLDFIAAVRTALEPGAIVAVMPVAVVDAELAAPNSAHRETWQLALGQAHLGNVHAVDLQQGQDS